MKNILFFCFAVLPLCASEPKQIDSHPTDPQQIF